MSDIMCVVCAHHNPGVDGGCTSSCRHTRAKVGLLCAGCATTVRRDLDDIVAARAWLLANHAGTSTATASGSERPLPGGVDRLDYLYGPELLGWAGQWARTWADPDIALPGTVPGLLAWLRADLEHRGMHTTLIAAFAAEVHTWADRGRALAGMTDQGQYVACPTISVDEGDCRRRLRIDVHRLDAPITCHSCGRVWSARQLLDMASRSSADVYLDVESLAIMAKVPERTLRRWASRGLIRRRHGLYCVGDTVAAKESEVTRYARKAPSSRRGG